MFPCFFTLLSVDCAKRWVVFTVNFVNNGYNRLTGILFVARKYVNESYLSSSIAADLERQIDQNLTKVQIPYYYRVSVRVYAGVYTSGPDEGKPIYATQDIISKEPFPKEWDITETKPVTITLTNNCGKCGKDGRPTMQKKGKENYHHPKYTSNQKEEFRLIYNHKQLDSTVKQCVIASFDKADGVFTEKGKLSEKAHKLIFPNFLYDKHHPSWSPDSIPWAEKKLRDGSLDQ